LEIVPQDGRLRYPVITSREPDLSVPKGCEVFNIEFAFQSLPVDKFPTAVSQYLIT
jgi:hypothetical protein